MPGLRQWVQYILLAAHYEISILAVSAQSSFWSSWLLSSAHSSYISFSAVQSVSSILFQVSGAMVSTIRSTGLCLLSEISTQGSKKLQQWWALRSAETMFWKCLCKVERQKTQTPCIINTFIMEGILSGLESSIHSSKTNRSNRSQDKESESEV